MKKLLLTTTALSALAAGSAFAETPTITLGGYADFQVGISDQESPYEIGPFDRDVHSRTDTEIHIRVDGKTDGGLGYGAYVEIEADVTGNDTTGDIFGDNNAERAYLYLEHNFGRVELGPNTDAGKALKVDAGTFASATGGISGDFYHYINHNALGTPNSGSTFLIVPDLPTAGHPDDFSYLGSNNVTVQDIRANANKITYYTPRISGFQGGVSFTPDQGERGTASGFSGENSTSLLGNQNSEFENVWNVGLNYKGEFNEFGIDASATGEWGEAELDSYDDLEAYALGLALSYQGFTLGGSWAHIEEMGRLSANGTEADYWTAGLAYAYGPFSASVTYLDSELENDQSSSDPDNEFQNISIGADYKMAPGLVPYVEVSFFETDSNSANEDNEGSVILVGTELNF